MDGEGQAAQPNVGFNVSFMGNIEEYSPNTDWKQYVERLEIFFELNNVQTDKQASSILTLMGSKMYGLLRSITAPRRPKELTYKEIVDTDPTFRGYRDEAIRDRFVCGLRNRAIQRKLLGEAELTLKLA